MGSGLAPQIAKAWPAAELADNLTTKGDENKLGKFTHCLDESVGLFVINMYTQYGFGEKPYSVDYQAVSNGFALLNAMILGTGVDHNYLQATDKRLVGIPMIGAGLAGGHWEAIKTIINLVTPDVQIELVVYKP
jgi:hypothetical protein